jgi:hypothetical protein
MHRPSWCIGGCCFTLMRVDGWWVDSFSLGSNSLVHHGGWLISLCLYYLPINNPLVVISVDKFLFRLQMLNLGFKFFWPIHELASLWWNWYKNCGTSLLLWKITFELKFRFFRYKASWIFLKNWQVEWTLQISSWF